MPTIQLWGTVCLSCLVCPQAWHRTLQKCTMKEAKIRHGSIRRTFMWTYEPGEAVLRWGRGGPSNPCRRVAKVHSGKGAESIQRATLKAQTEALNIEQGVHIFRAPWHEWTESKKVWHTRLSTHQIPYRQSLLVPDLGVILFNLPCFNVKTNIRKICSWAFLKIHRIIEKMSSIYKPLVKHNRVLARLLCRTLKVRGFDRRLRHIWEATERFYLSLLLSLSLKSIIYKNPRMRIKKY